MEEKSQFKIIFRGEIKPAYTVEQVKQNIAKLFKVPTKRLDKWFSGQTITIKEQIDYNTARRYQQALEKAGAICSIEGPKRQNEEIQNTKINNLANTSSPGMVCPKCGFEQPQSEECQRCQIVIKKYIEYKKQLDSVEKASYRAFTSDLEYKQCKCKYWVTSKDIYCSNCGLELKNKRIDTIRYFFLITFLLQGGIFFGFTTSKAGSLKDSLIAGGFGLVMGGLFGLVVSLVIKRLYKGVKWSVNLLNTEKRIRRGINFADFQQKIGDGLKKVHQSYEEEQDIISWIADINRRQEFHQSMDDLIDDATLKQYRLNAQLWALQLVRWQNTLVAFFSNWLNKTEETHKTRIETLANLSQFFNSTLQEWMQSDIANIPEGYQCIIRLHKASNLTNQVYQRLLKESGLNINFNDVFKKESPFNVLPTIEEFYENTGEARHKAKRQHTLIPNFLTLLIGGFWLFCGLITILMVVVAFSE